MDRAISASEANQRFSEMLRDVAEGRGVGDTTTLADTTVMDAIANKLTGGATD